jgi:Putative esterase
MKHLVIVTLASLSLTHAQIGPNGATASFRGSLPPPPVAEPSASDLAPLQAELTELTTIVTSLKGKPNLADAEIFTKAVRYAIELHEWFDKKPADNLKKAKALLAEARLRLSALQQGKAPWTEGSGLKVLGFYSDIDGSPQPYGVEIPDGLKVGPGQAQVPMWVWLHGRGDTATDLNFVYSRLMAKKRGEFQPAGTIVIHPFGRYCNGWKSAGETDIFEAKADATLRFNVDPNRTALAGFSMGGAGAWHIGAHFASEWACVHTGAGFVDVQRYTKVTPETMPPSYEAALWGVYDVPAYALNFKNVPIISYSGENDSQRDSADYMTEVFATHGMSRPHLIGPGMGHKYHPDVRQEVQALVEAAVTKGRDPLPAKVVLQTRTLAYNTMHWLTVTGLTQHWQEGRVEAEWNPSTGSVTATTKGVTGLRLKLSPTQAKQLTIDGDKVELTNHRSGTAIWQAQKRDGHWFAGATFDPNKGLPKQHNLQGPIDDGLRHKFIIILPDNDNADNTVDQWVQAEAKRFIQRWRSLMRGDPIVKRPAELTETDADTANLVVWGTPTSNSLLFKMMQAKNFNSALTWTSDTVGIGKHQHPTDSHVATLCRPNPLNPRRYVILNSGLTFREAHDKTNSLQNPKLPDWAILDISSPATNASAGKVVAADFFGEDWAVK